MSLQNTQIQREIFNQIDEILKLDIDNDILKTEKRNEIDFKDIRGELVSLFAILRKIRNVELLSYSAESLSRVNKKLNSISGVIIQIESFSLIQNDPNGDRVRLTTNFFQEYTEIVPMLLSILQFTSVTQDSVVSTESLMFEIREAAEKKFNDFNELLRIHTRTVNENVQEFGMKKYAKTFEIESIEYRKSADNWLRYTIILLVATVLIAISTLLFNDVISSTVNVVQYTVTKVFIISALFYGINICAKNYKAHKHNEVLNKHRHNALITFEAFTASSNEDQQTKSAVLLAATQTIFGNQNTGYTDGDSADNDLSTKIIEIIKTPNGK